MILREKDTRDKQEHRFLEQIGFAGEQLRVVARVNDQEAVKNLVAGGVGISFISELAARNFIEEKRVLCFQLPHSSSRMLYLAHKKHVELPAHVRAFIEYVRKMEKQLKETERKIENINKAIAEGAYSSSTGTMLRALENTAAQLRLSIESRKYAEGQLMDRDRILFYLTTFSRLNREDPHDRRLLIRTFLNAVYVYDDHLRVLVNTSDECVQIPFEELPPEVRIVFHPGCL